MSMHLALHVLVLVALAVALSFDHRLRHWAVVGNPSVWMILVWLTAGMIIDADHLLADPIYDADRCSIGFHPLHRFWAFPVYGALLIWRRTRLLALGLVVHITMDAIDCL